MKESYFQHSFIEQIEHFKVLFFADILSTNSKLGKCNIAVFCDMVIAQVDIAMMIKKQYIVQAYFLYALNITSQGLQVP